MHPPIKEEQKKDFTDRLFVAECTLLKVVDFKLDLDALAGQKDYVRRFCKNLYDPLLGSQAAENIVKFAEAVSNDTIFTYVNLLYSVQTVALACVLLGSARYSHPVPTGSNCSVFAKTFELSF